MCFPEKNLGGEMMHVWALLDLVLVVKGIWKGTGLLKSKVSFFRRYHKARHILIFREVFYLKKKVERQWNVLKIGVLTSTIIFSGKKTFADHAIWLWNMNFCEFSRNKCFLISLIFWLCEYNLLYFSGRLRKYYSKQLF